MSERLIFTLGKDLKVGDTIQTWWKPNRDTITNLIPYSGPLSHLWQKDGGAQIASFVINKVGMTIEPIADFYVVVVEEPQCLK